MKRFFTFGILILVTCLPAASSAQILHVRALDSFTHKPLMDVQIAGIEIVVTDKNGQAEINVHDQDEKLRFIKEGYYPFFIQASTDNFDNPYEIEFFLVRKTGTAIQPVSIKNQDMAGYVEFEYVFADDSTSDSSLHLWIYDDANGFANRTSLTSSLKGPGLIQIDWSSKPEYTSSQYPPPPVHLTKFSDDGQKFFFIKN